jgi:hypothetical protein
VTDHLPILLGCRHGSCTLLLLNIKHFLNKTDKKYALSLSLMICDLYLWHSRVCYVIIQNKYFIIMLSHTYIALSFWPKAIRFVTGF